MIYNLNMFANPFKWLSEGFNLFKKAWGVFILQTLFVILAIVVSYLMKILILSAFLYIVQIILIAGMFVSFDKVKNSQKITFDNLFDGFSNNLPNLLTISLIFLFVGLVVSFLLTQVVNINGLVLNFKHLNEQSYLLFGIIMITDLIINFILFLSIPFIAIQKLNAFKAIRQSILVFYKSFSSLLVFFLLYFVLAIIATFSFIGWILFFPISIGMIYLIYLQSYIM